jgi:hypothetical protein
MSVDNFAYVRENGFVTLRGRTGARAPHPIWSLPDGYAPVEDMYFRVPSSSGEAWLTVMADGSLVADVDTDWITLNDVEFRHA